MLNLKVNLGLLCLLVIAIQSIIADPVTLPPAKAATAPTKITDPVTTPPTKATSVPTKITDPVTTPPTKATTPSQTTKVTTPLATTPVSTTEAVEATTEAETEATTIAEWEESDGCLYKDRLWPSIDGTKFYFCLPGTNTPVQQSCNRLTFFMMTKQMSGCVPFSEITTNCINHDVVGACTGNNLLQPQTDINPTYFYLCLGENESPLKLQCEEGKAFLHQDGYLGCFEWEEWRKIRGCPMYG